MKLLLHSRNSLMAVVSIAVLLSTIMVFHATADGIVLNLPPDFVTVEVGNSPTTFFSTVLSNVPSGYDITNKNYSGWCVDRTRNMTYYYPFEATVDSSLNASGQFADAKWDMVNYVLNHKQGDSTDIQQAIWHFINGLSGDYTPTRLMAILMVNDAEANGAGFVPTTGQTVAVILYPTPTSPGSPSVQVSIIELQVPVIPEISPPLILVLMALATLIAAKAWRGKPTRNTEAGPSS